MAKSSNSWKKGRGKLGLLHPLLGEWEANADSLMGKVKCTRKFTCVLRTNYIQLDAAWHFGEEVYQEKAFFGLKEDLITCWSFTSDGKNSTGVISDGTDDHKEALCFEAQMPAGLARMIYWPTTEGFNWAVESKNKKGWNRFTIHHYKPAK